MVGDSLKVVAGGLVTGLAAAWLLAPRLEELLYNVAPRDVVTFLGIVVVLFLVSLIAAGAPALRASRVDPIDALRAE